MAADLRGNPWKFDATTQGEGMANSGSYMKWATFTTTHASELVNITGHNLQTGDGPFRMTTSGADLPNGFAINTDYWIIYVSADTLKVASSLANAEAGTAVSISDDGTGTHTLVRLPVFDHKIYVKEIAAIGDGTNAGTVEVTTKSGGPILARLELGSTANGNPTQVQPIYDFVEGVYVNTLDATNAIVLVYHGRI